jgi:oxygen-independent coproporphyrinogen-3 oxidase
LLYLTRGLSLMEIDCRDYNRTFASHLPTDFTGAWTAMSDAGLLTIDEDAARLTPRGMFYADSVAGMLAGRRIAELRADAAADESMHHSMG